MTARVYSDTVPTVALLGATTSSGGISNSDTTMVLAASLNSYFSSTFPFAVRLEPNTANEEVVLVASGTGVAGTPYVITRGAGTTTAKAHVQGSIVEHVVYSQDLIDSQTHVNTTGSATVHGLNTVFSKLPVIADKIVYVASHGNDSNDGLTLTSAFLTLGAAVTAVGAAGGTIQLAGGTTTLSSQLSLASKTSIRIRGASSGTTAGAAPSTIISFTGTGSSPAIDAAHSVGIIFEDLMVLYTSASFTGVLLNFGATSGAAASYNKVQNCYFGGSSVNTAASLIDLRQAQNTHITNCHFSSAAIGIYGWDGTHQSNRILIDNCVFRNHTDVSIRNPGEAWTVSSCTFEGGSVSNAISHDSGVLVQGLLITGCWTGDTSGGTQFDIQGDGFAIIGNWIGATTGTAVNIGASSTGFEVRDNYIISATNGIVLGASCSNYSVTPNKYDTVTTKQSGGAATVWVPPVDSTSTYVWASSSGSTILTFNSNNGRFGTNGIAPGAHFHSGGGIAYAYVAKTTTYTTGSSDHHVTGDATGGAFTITLLSAVGQTGREFFFTKIDSGGNAVTIGTTSSQTINGSTTYALSAQYKYVRVISNGANWVITGNN